jgi:hypothetical protein
MSLLERIFDERFLEHRRRSTSYAGVAGGYVAIGLFAWRFFAQHRWSWDLLAVALTIVVVKMALISWYSFKD